MVVCFWDGKQFPRVLIFFLGEIADCDKIVHELYAGNTKFSEAIATVAFFI